MRLLTFVAPRLAGAMGNATIRTHLVLHIAKNILNFGVPEVMNSSYAESAHIPISKDNTQYPEAPKNIHIAGCHALC